MENKIEKADEVMSDENALMIVRMIKGCQDREGVQIIKTLVDRAQEKIVTLVRQLTNK